MLNVLVTGVGGGVGQGIIKCLRLIRDLDIRVICADMSALASGHYAGDYCHLVPAATDERYFDAILAICRQHQIDYYFPGTDIELQRCSVSANELREQLGVKIIVSPASVVEIADDKLKTIRFLEANGHPAPLTWLPEDVDLEALTYPVVVKPRVGFRSIGVQVVYTSREARAAIQSLSAPIIQEYIDGDEFTCTVAVYNGDVSDVLCLRRDLRAGDTYRAFPRRDSVIEDYVRRIAKDLGVHGSCNFQLRLGPHGPKLFEINSRFSGTTPFCAYLGFNPVEFCLKKDRGISYRSNIDYSKTVVRHWCEVVVDSSQLSRFETEREGKIIDSVVSTML